MPFVDEAMLAIVEDANDIQFSDIYANFTDMGAEIRDLHKGFEQLKWYGRKNALCITHPNWSNELQNENTDQCCSHYLTRIVSLHEPFQGCAVYIPGLCSTVCVNTPFVPIYPACTCFCCHAIVLNVYSGHMPIWGGVWENDLVWIIQMVRLWCTAGWASATKMHAFDRDMHLAVGVWWCGGHLSPWQDTPGHY